MKERREELRPEAMALLLYNRALNYKFSQRKGDVLVFSENKDKQEIGVPNLDKGRNRMRLLPLPERFGKEQKRFGDTETIKEVKDLLRVHAVDRFFHVTHAGEDGWGAGTKIIVSPSPWGELYLFDEIAHDRNKEVGRRMSIAVSQRDLRDADKFFEFFQEIILNKGYRTQRLL